MTNIERQASLNKGQATLADNNGTVAGNTEICPYCSFCAMVTNNETCSVRLTARTEQCLCAKAYNRMVRANGQRAFMRQQG